MESIAISNKQDNPQLAGTSKASFLYRFLLVLQNILCLRTVLRQEMTQHNSETQDVLKHNKRNPMRLKKITPQAEKYPLLLRKITPQHSLACQHITDIIHFVSITSRTLLIRPSVFSDPAANEQGTP